MVNRIKTFMLNGKEETYDSLAEMSGVPADTLKNRFLDNRDTPISELMYPRKMNRKVNRKIKRYDVDGEMLTAYQISKATGVNLRQMTRRLANMAIKDALDPLVKVPAKVRKEVSDVGMPWFDYDLEYKRRIANYKKSGMNRVQIIEREKAIMRFA